MNRRIIGGKSGWCAVAIWVASGWAQAAGTAAGAAAAARPPNLVFIMADDLGMGHLGCYGQQHIRTPNLDRMAAEGLRFRQAYSGCTVCAPSRSALMTGLHTGHTPVRGNSGGISLAAGDVTVAKVLQKAGYATGLYGKWGLGDAGSEGVPNRQGFDEFFGYLHQVHAHFFYPEYLWKNQAKFPLPGNAGGKRGQYSHDEIADQAFQFVRQNRDRPFYLNLAFTIPHLELLVPEKSLNLYKGKFEEVPYANPKSHYAEQPTPKAAYAGMVTHMDESIGQLFALLKQLRLDDQTIVFFTSDNGAQSGLATDPVFFKGNAHLRGFKTDFFEGGIRVPMLVRWPGRIAPGTVTDQVWAHWDWLPTAAALAGAQAPKGLDGLSLVPALRGQKQAAQHEFLYWEFTFGKRLAQAVRTGDWKAIRLQPGQPLELYHLQKDPGEVKNVAADHPEVVQKIEAYLKNARTEPRPQTEPAKEPGRKYAANSTP